MLITIKQDNKAIDIKVNEQQKIYDVLEVLDDKKIISVGDVYKVKSLRKNVYVIALKTFSDNGIYNGDILEIENQWNLQT